MIYDMSIKDAVSKGVINNQTLAYFLARSFLFLKSVGIKAEAIRFR
jgi:glycyl-tRNA synthetase